mmetsp:Transcript_33712/g.57837  ORF Transcript_33712/g.57837 Transcript_33712/m.57837 type:complete len:253 (-) Transcript_33712:167-925(-)
MVRHVSIPTRAAAQHTTRVASSAAVAALPLAWVVVAGALTHCTRRGGGHATQAGLRVISPHQGLLGAGQSVGPRARASAGVGPERIGVTRAGDHHTVHRGGLAESCAEHTRAAAADGGGTLLGHGAGGVLPQTQHAVVVDLVPDAFQRLHGFVYFVHHVRRIFLRLDAQVPSATSGREIPGIHWRRAGLPFARGAATVHHRHHQAICAHAHASGRNTQPGEAWGLSRRGGSSVLARHHDIFDAFLVALLVQQ